MANKLQRTLLWQMIAADGLALIITGHKSTSWGGTLKTGPAVIRCSECVLWGLSGGNKYIEKLTQKYSSEHIDHTYRITEKGIKAAGKVQPEMVVAHIGAHGPRWK